MRALKLAAYLFPLFFVIPVFFGAPVLFGLVALGGFCVAPWFICHAIDRGF